MHGTDPRRITRLPDVHGGGGAVGSPQRNCLAVAGQLLWIDCAGPPSDQKKRHDSLPRSSPRGAAASSTTRRWSELPGGDGTALTIRHAMDTSLHREPPQVWPMQPTSSPPRVRGIFSVVADSWLGRPFRFQLASDPHALSDSRPLRKSAACRALFARRHVIRNAASLAASRVTGHSCATPTASCFVCQTANDCTVPRHASAASTRPVHPAQREDAAIGASAQRSNEASRRGLRRRSCPVARSRLGRGVFHGRLVRARRSQAKLRRPPRTPTSFRSYLGPETNTSAAAPRTARFRPVASHPLLPCVRVAEDEPTGSAKARARECHIDGGHSFAGRRGTSHVRPGFLLTWFFAFGRFP
jgi:hypothetical protein